MPEPWGHLVTISLFIEGHVDRATAKRIEQGAVEAAILHKVWARSAAIAPIDDEPQPGRPGIVGPDG